MRESQPRYRNRFIANPLCIVGNVTYLMRWFAAGGARGFKCAKHQTEEQGERGKPGASRHATLQVDGQSWPPTVSTLALSRPLKGKFAEGNRNPKVTFKPTRSRQILRCQAVWKWTYWGDSDQKRLASHNITFRKIF